MIISISPADIAALAGGLLALVSGTAMTWSSPELDKIKNDTSIEPMSDDQGSWVASALVLGQAFGPMIFGSLSDVIGRKSTLLVISPVVACAFLAMAFAKVLVIFYVARFVTGFCLGALILIPIYVGEIANPKNRGLIGSITGGMSCVGQLFSYAVGPYVSVLWFNIILSVFPVVSFIAFYFLGVESPHYYVTKGKREQAKKVLQKLRGANANVEEELQQIEDSMKKEGKGRFLDIFKSRALTRALSISFGLIVCQQLCGNSAVTFYAQSIFEKANTNLDPAICSIIIGAVLLASSFLTSALIESKGRKFLLLSSAIGMAISEVVLGIYYYLSDHGHDLSSVSFLPILCLVSFIIAYQSGFGALPFVMSGEIFPSNIKTIATSVSSLCSTVIGFLGTKYFPTISDSIGMGPSFWIFAAFNVAAVPFVFYVVIETKGKTLEQIQNDLSS